MQMLVLGEDSDGVSHFEIREIALPAGDFAPPAPPMGMSVPIDSARVLFLSLPPGWRDSQHCTPRRQLAFSLAGTLRVTAGDGEVRDVGPGGIWLMEDTTGQGHGSEVVGDVAVELAIAQLD